MRRAVWTVLCALGLSAAGAACGGGGASAGGLQVVAGFYPLAEAASRIGGERVSVTNLTPAGAEPHDLELTTRDFDRIEAAAVILYIGRGFQPGVEEAVRRARGRAVDLLDPDLGVMGGSPPLGGAGADPHVWLDPALMVRIAGEVQAALTSADPAGREVYEANAAAYTASLATLDGEYERGLASCERRTIVTSHSAFGYLARRYGLSEDAVSGLDPEAEPDPRRLSEVAAKVRAEGITTIFYETLVSPEVARTLARATGAEAAVLNPIEGLTSDERRQGKDYVALMRDNLAALRAALGCR